MRDRWYIESTEHESWRTVSGLFGAWLSETIATKELGSFGWSEGAQVVVPGHANRFVCFEFPAHHGEKILLFEPWAKATGRIYGYWESDAIHFLGGALASIPLKREMGISWPPPWIVGTTKAR